MGSGSQITVERRAFLLGWIPFFHRSKVDLCGVEFRVRRYAFDSPRRFLVIHGDEDTARDVLSTWMYDHNGVAYLVTGKDRDVEIQGAKIDPNRMFSRAGAERSVKSLNPNIDPDKLVSLLDFLDRQREELLKRLIPPHGSRLFALHNNRDYSVHDEIASSDQTSIKQPSQPTEFFLCTDPKDYDILKQSPFNVVLQTKSDPDDGSLSRLAARRGFRYINLECGIGQYEAQIDRVQWLEDHIP
jgi:hypothetical protein